MLVPNGSAAAEASAGHKDTVWLGPTGFAALFAILVFSAFPQVILGWQTFVYRDFGYFGYPLAYHFRESFWRGEVPLWNPLNNCGLPFLAQWNTQTLYPPALFYLLFPLSWSLGMFCLAHMYLAALGMYFLALRWTANHLAAGIAGVAFAFNGLMLNCLMWPNNVAAMGWMPWVVWLVERAWREGGRAVLTAVVVSALQMLAGAPEITLLTWGFLTVLALSECGTRSVEHGIKDVLQLCIRLTVVVVLIAALCAAQLLPFLDLLAHSHRDSGYGGAAWSMPLAGWANFLVPLFHCHPSFHGVFLQTGQCWTASYYVGVAVVTLAVLAVWRVRERRVWVLSAMSLIGLVLALGDAGHAYRWLREHVEVLGLMRYPIKFVVVPVFALPLLASFAVARLGPGCKDSGRMLAALSLLVVFLTVTLLWFARRFPLPDDQWDSTGRNTLVRLVFLAIILIVLPVLGRIERRPVRGGLQVVLLVLVALDLLTHAPLQQTVPRRMYEPNVPRQERVPRHGAARAMVSPAAAAELQHSFIPDPAKDFLTRRWALVWNCNLLDDIPVVDGFYSLYLPEEVSVGALLLAATNSSAPRLADFLGVAMMSPTNISPTNIFEWTIRPGPLPLVTAGQKPAFLEPRATLERLASPDFDPRREVFLPPAARPFISASNAARAEILSTSFKAQQIDLQVKADTPTMVVAAQSYYHPWRAYVDGQPVTLWRANYAFQALEVPAGRHRVELVYHDKLFLLGTIISLATLLGCVGRWLGFSARMSGTERDASAKQATPC